MARLITAKMRAMLDYRPGQLCPICNKPMGGPHAGREDVAKVNGAWRVVHRSHRAGIFAAHPEPDPRLWPTW